MLIAILIVLTWFLVSLFYLSLMKATKRADVRGNEIASDFFHRADSEKKNIL
ncbi:hypothetical protein PU629_03660 [Pullulanibacillus sp. KACC 23026]|uniref:hypothetical protein n=1 Tax=Pullulanibacillus sp. KACC 23026 TaxID=3028315 RepID=UPI0023B0EAA7|nr:hypothetical protein [Pullulanibacillus sp. KACC 23026]WEG13478.1 hypothetical protein PU629_03660 [Pullulanibacillus sp. KACC 23026]